MPEEDKRKKIILIISGLSFFLLPIIIWLSILIKNNLNPKESVHINGLSNYTKDQKTNFFALDYIKNELFHTIKYNTPENFRPDNLKDINIRKNSFKQIEDKTNDRNIVDFIVDIPSIKQSYQIHYAWDNKNKGISTTETTVKCLPNNQLIYPKFKCWDKSRKLSGSADPISTLLPHFDNNFKIIAKNLDDQKPKLTIYIFIFRYNTKSSDYPKATNNIKNKIKTWFSNQSLNIDDYDIEYIVKIK